MVADGIATKGQFYFKLSSEVINRSSSHMCGRLYLPMFLLRDGSLTLMYNASLMDLMRFWSSLPTILNFSIVTVWPEVLEWSYIGEGAFWCSLNLSPNVLDDSPRYSSSHSTLSYLYLYMTSLFWRMGSLSFGAMRKQTSGSHIWKLVSKQNLILFLRKFQSDMNLNRMRNIHLQCQICLVYPWIFYLYFVGTCPLLVLHQMSNLRLWYPELVPIWPKYHAWAGLGSISLIVGHLCTSLMSTRLILAGLRCSHTVPLGFGMITKLL